MRTALSTVSQTRLRASTSVFQTQPTESQPAPPHPTPSSPLELSGHTNQHEVQSMRSPLYDCFPSACSHAHRWLLLLKIKNASAGIGLESELRAAGAKNNGLMRRTQFLICLRSVYREWHFMDEVY